MIASVQKAPRLTQDVAERIVSELYSIASSATPLPSERDQNFLIKIQKPDRKGGCNNEQFGAVITTREIADSFANGMEYFNTFGGNPVSCAVGLAVLDVIRDEELQQNAQQVGQYLLDGLRQLQQKHPLIGDVRGLGLFLGIEFVRDRGTLEPADAVAAQIVELMKERGVLLSTDGPFHNVIKIKPPLVFSEKDADVLLTNLNDVLEEMG